jgi:hypothetical protein
MYVYFLPIKFPYTPRILHARFLAQQLAHNRIILDSRLLHLTLATYFFVRTSLDVSETI